LQETLGGHPLGDPLQLLPWFVRHVHQRCGGVRAGDLVTAGTWAGMLPAKQGDHVEVVFESIGQASVDFG
jgi:2-keto-4-pentenoate hydratase